MGMKVVIEFRIATASVDSSYCEHPEWFLDSCTIEK